MISLISIEKKDAIKNFKKKNRITERENFVELRNSITIDTLT